MAPQQSTVPTYASPHLISQKYYKDSDTLVEESGRETITKLYDKFISTYGRPPRLPDMFKSFASKFHDVHLSYGTAKLFIHEMNSQKPSLTPSAKTNGP